MPMMAITTSNSINVNPRRLMPNPLACRPLLVATLSQPDHSMKRRRG
jgi:hypothetical protein